MGDLFTVIKIIQERVSRIKRILCRIFRRDTERAIVLTLYVISGPLFLYATHIIPLLFFVMHVILPFSNMLSILLSIFLSILVSLCILRIWYIFPVAILAVCLAVIFVVEKLSEKLPTKKLSGFWVIRIRKIYMGINFREMKKIRQIRKPLKDSNSTDRKKREVRCEIMQYFADGIVELLNSSKIKSGKVYSTKTHKDVLSRLERNIPEGIEMISKKEAGQKYLATEYIMVWGINEWLELYFGANEELNEKIYKQFYRVKFRKLPKKSPGLQS